MLWLFDLKIFRESIGAFLAILQGEECLQSGLLKENDLNYRFCTGKTLKTLHSHQVQTMLVSNLPTSARVSYFATSMLTTEFQYFIKIINFLIFPPPFHLSYFRLFSPFCLCVYVLNILPPPPLFVLFIHFVCLCVCMCNQHFIPFICLISVLFVFCVCVCL